MARLSHFIFASALAFGLSAAPAKARDHDDVFFKNALGTWSGPGEIVAGKYKGTRFTCTLLGSQTSETTAIDMDGSCRVGMFKQDMKATIHRAGKKYRGHFLDGAKGKGLDITSGNVDGDRVVFSLIRKQLTGAMLARMANPNQLNVTISVEVDKQLVPVIGMKLNRTSKLPANYQAN